MKVWSAVSGLALVVAWSAPSRAQGIDEFGTFPSVHEERDVESPQHVAFEFRIGRYLPNVDSEFQNARPYDTIFGDKNRYSVALELDWQLIRIPYFGTFGPGVGLGYTKSSGKSLVTSDLDAGIITPSDEGTSLTIIPAYVVGVLRADYLARRYNIPLVPYAKLGLGAAVWSVGSGGGTANFNGTAGHGLSFGPQFALGGMFLLDFLDPSAAKEMDNDTGVNNSYFFAEWYVSDIGTGDQLHVGTNTWVLGLAFEI